MNCSFASRGAAPISHPMFEQLESRNLFAVSLGTGGWTSITTSDDTRIVFVSSSAGSDSNSGLSSSSPVRTLAKAKSLLRSGMPDWMLLKRGDTWNEAIGGWNKSGRSSSEPMLIAAYGTGKQRPLLKTGTANGMDTGGKVVDHLAIMGIHFYASGRDPGVSGFSTASNYGLRFVGSTKGLLVENCVFDQYGSNLNFEKWNGTLNNIKVRRNIITDSYTTSGSAAGLYANAVSGLVIEENVFDHNGWNEQVSASINTPSHNIYLQAGTAGAIVRGNIIANAGSHGLQARGGGTVRNNLFLDNPIGMTFGNGSTARVGGVSGAISGNVFQGTRDIRTPGRGWGYAIEIGNTRAGGNTVVRDNIFSQDGAGEAAAIVLAVGGTSNFSQTVGINDLTIDDNIIYDWKQALSLSGSLVAGGSGPTGLNDLRVQDNDMQYMAAQRMVWHGPKFNGGEEIWSNNRYHDESSTSGWYYLDGANASFDKWKSTGEGSAQRTQVSYKAPGRTMASYSAALGGSSSVDGFLAKARQQAAGSWNRAYTATAGIQYVQVGFNEV